MSDALVFEAWIDTTMGKVYAKTWTGAGLEASRNAPIILLHDSLGCVDLWRDFPQRLALDLRRTVVAYDRIGFGKSAPYSGSLALTFVHDEAATTFKAVVDHFGFDRFIVFGHSVGGGMAVEIASQFPKACEALITESAQAFVEDRTLEGIRQAQQSFAISGQIDRLTKYHGDKSAWVLDAWINTWLSPAFSNWSLDQPAQKIVSPLLAIHGEDDEYGSPKHPERIASKAKGSSIVKLLPDCGHVPHRQHSDVVIKLASDFLSSLGN